MRREKVEIKKLGINGEGIGYVDKKVCFIDGALPGEVVDVELESQNRKFYKGKIVQYIKKSNDRIDSICPDDKFCQGCSLTTMKYEKQLPYKKGILKDALKKYTSFDTESLPIKNLIESSLKEGYKQVVSLPVTYFKGKVRVGIYQRESKYLTLMNQCPMQNTLINQVLVKVENIFNEYGVRDYNDKVKKGMRFIRVRCIDTAVQILLVTGNDGVKPEVIKAISEIKEVKSIYYSINTTRYQDFDMQGFKKVYGQSTLTHYFCDQKYIYSMKSEFPIYPAMEERKLKIIQSFIPQDAFVLSVGCGVGLLELSINNQVVAIDDKNYHIKDTKDNAHFLKKDNVQFICKNIDEAIVQQCKKNHFDVAVIRREKLTDAMKQSLILSKVKQVVYVSDHPSSLAKDLEELQRYFDIESMIPLDTYPYTVKFDTITVLKRKS